MGVVRREGDWRLEKRGEGVYEITFQKETQLKVFTEERASGQRQATMFDAVPNREVSSYAEVEGLFEEKAHGPPPFGMDYSATQGTQDGLDFDSGVGDDVDLSEVPPGVFGVALLIAGSFMLYTFWGADNAIVQWLGIGFVGGGAAVLSYGVYLFKTTGWDAGWAFFLQPDSNGTTSTDSPGTHGEKTPPAPDSLKNELFFERANRCCEYCGEDIDHPEVHHITQRSQGGSNDRQNLIVLCPNCHRKADRGAIGKSKLRYQIRNA